MDWNADDVITTDRYLAAFPRDYYKTVVFYHGAIVWRGRYHAPPSSPRDRIIAGHADYPITDAIVERYPAREWHAVNAVSEKVQGLPLGITNDCLDSPIHPIYGNIPQMVQVSREPRNIRNLVYMNFSLHTHPCRSEVWNRFAEKPWVTQGTAVASLAGRREFLRDLRNHEFVLCPRGNGVDTHRLWETLYMGSIPVVQRDPVHRGWMDLPICWIDSWDEVTPEFLEGQKAEILARRVNLEKLKVGYWIRTLRPSE